MQALLTRPVYYQLAELCTNHIPDSQNKSSLGIWSSGVFFSLANEPDS